jgi:hypothetical protein
VIVVTRIARRHVARPPATHRSAPRVGAIVSVPKAASIIEITNARIAPA